MLSEIEFKKIADKSAKVVSKYSKNWAKATVITSYCYDSYNGFGLSYQDSESNKLSYWGEKYSDLPQEEMYSFDGYDDINEILRKYYNFSKNDPNLRWNKAKIIILPDGSYEGEFIWDEQADLENLMLAVWQTIDYWGNNILFDYLCSVYPDWQKAVIKSYIKGNKVIFQLISLSEQDVLINIDIPEDIQADYIAWQEYCINGKLKPLFTTPWNGIIFNLDISKDFFGKLDSNFIFEGNS